MYTITKRLTAAVLLLIPGFALAQEPVEQYDQLIREIDALAVYNDLLQTQIANQASELEAIQTAIGRVPDLERQIPPLLTRMINGLEEFIELDIPFRADERTERVAELQLLVEDSNINNAEKMRRILEAYQIENEFGREVEAYLGELQVAGGVREVSFLKIGRIAWIYQTNDEDAVSGIWNHETRTWDPLGNQHRNSIRQALRMARNQVAPDLVLVPLTPPTTE